jgi:hypothetical protein
MLDGFLPVFVVASAPKERRSRLAEAMLPGLLPVAAAARAGVAAVVADQQVRSADRRQEQAVTETVSAVETIASKPSGSRTLTDQDLSGLPTLKGIVEREGIGSTIRGQIDGVAGALDGGDRGLAVEATNLIAKAINQPKQDKLPEADLKGSRIGALILANPDLKAKVVAAPPAAAAAGGGGAGGSGPAPAPPA